MNEAKILTMLGFARKANYLVAGESNVKDSVMKRKNAHLLILASDLSPGKIKYWERIAEEFEIPVLTVLNKYDIGNAIGMSPRGLVAITNIKMSNSILNLK